MAKFKTKDLKSAYLQAVLDIKGEITDIDKQKCKEYINKVKEQNKGFTFISLPPNEMFDKFKSEWSIL